MKVNLILLTISKLSIISLLSIFAINAKDNFSLNYKIKSEARTTTAPKKTEQPHKYKKGDKTEITEIGFYKKGSVITIKQIPYYVKKVPETLPEEIQSLHRAFAQRYSKQEHPTVTGFEKWDTKNITDMSYVFYDNEVIDADLSGWKTDNVTNMTGMFKNAIKFNNMDKTLGWNTEKVESMESMFDGAKSFKQSLKDWKVENVIKNRNFSRASGIYGVKSKNPSWKTPEEDDPIIKKVESEEPKVIIHPSPRPRQKLPLTKIITPPTKITPTPLTKSTMTQNQTSKKLSTPAIVGIVIGTQAILTSLGFGIPYIIKRFKK
ncbi:hypothetical protein MFERI14815_00125 [Mycoplasma feriruminatoris]|uniref:BspA family leucine-rich repeat surface protein n=1 Tax=Mycoplasma feriruminatoris TaxID=1179777 RepID=UPI00241D0C4E|nr:BspA family leucine-rich repeat surface protein [Mycoplasma feriruminatoris]WFQ91538.1 hypothetical protein MFERI14815_00125 [Mycoplasma feriruminatoris]